EGVVAGTVSLPDPAQYGKPVGDNPHFIIKLYGKGASGKYDALIKSMNAPITGKKAQFHFDGVPAQKNYELIVQYQGSWSLRHGPLAYGHAGWPNPFYVSPGKTSQADMQLVVIPLENRPPPPRPNK